MSELARVFSIPANGGHGGHGHGLANDEMQPGQSDTLATRLATAEARLTDALDQITDLRTRLDEERTDRRQALDRLAAAQERIAALLTDQRSSVAQPAPRRAWWRWR